MLEEISRKEAQRLIEAGAQVLDVLELSEYRESHVTTSGRIVVHLLDPTAA